jgi:cysteinyl-tRNA synthetase
LLNSNPQDFLQGREDNKIDGVDTDYINKLIDERNKARASKNFDRADAIRNELQDLGVSLEDSEDSTDWRR